MVSRSAGPRPPTVIPNEAGRLFLPLSLPRKRRLVQRETSLLSSVEALPLGPSLILDWHLENA